MCFALLLFISVYSGLWEVITFHLRLYIVEILAELPLTHDRQGYSNNAHDIIIISTLNDYIACVSSAIYTCMWLCNMASKFVDVRVDPGRLKGSRGLLSGLLVGALVTAVVCLSVFTAKHNDIQAITRTPFGVVVQCSLFIDFASLTVGSNSNCDFAIAGSATVMVLVVLLLAETLSIIFCTFSFME